jgi:hypothetical protein
MVLLAVHFVSLNNKNKLYCTIKMYECLFGTGLIVVFFKMFHGRFMADCKNGCLRASAVVIRFEGCIFIIFDSRSNAWSSFFQLRPVATDRSALAAHPVVVSCQFPSPYSSRCSPSSCCISVFPTMHPISCKCFASTSFPFAFFRIIPALQTSTAAVCTCNLLCFELSYREGLS